MSYPSYPSLIPVIPGTGPDTDSSRYAGRCLLDYLEILQQFNESRFDAEIPLPSVEWNVVMHGVDGSVEHVQAHGKAPAW